MDVPQRPGPREVVAHVAAMVEEAAASQRRQEAGGTGERAFGGAPGLGSGSGSGTASAEDRVATLGRRARPGRDAGGRRRQRMASAVAEAMRAGRDDVEAAPLAVATGWRQVDQALAARSTGRATALDRGSVDPEGSAMAGLLRGQLHEWFALTPSGASPAPTGGVAGTARTRWRPPMTVLAHLADRAAATAIAAGTGGVIAWVGHRVWPSPGFAAARNRLDQSIYLDPPDEASRLWTLELLLRSSAITAVVADGSGLSMAATRRLQLAARAGRALVLLARPAHELLSLSAAATRWTVEPVPTTRDQPEWRLALRRCKGGAESRSVGLTVGLAGADSADGRTEQPAEGPWRIHWNGSAVEQDSQDAARTTIHDGMRMHGRREREDAARGPEAPERRDGREREAHGRASRERQAFLHPVLASFGQSAGHDGAEERFGRGRGRGRGIARVGPAA